MIFVETDILNEFDSPKTEEEFHAWVRQHATDNGCALVDHWDSENAETFLFTCPANETIHKLIIAIFGEDNGQDMIENYEGYSVTSIDPRPLRPKNS